MKQCSKCKEWKELSKFYKRKDSKDGYRNECKLCKNKYIREWKNNNKDKIKEQNKKYCIKNKDKISKWQKEYYIKNKDKIDRYQQKWYINNKENVLLKCSIRIYSNAIYETYKDKLTIDESPRLSKDGISLEVKCRYCGKYFIPNNSQLHSRISTLNGKMQGEGSLYCSNGCKESCPIFNQHNWPKGFKKATSREAQPVLRQLVLKRDEYTCQKCGSTEILHCHHILPLNESPIESADISNCITLCKQCHKEVHKIPGCGNNELQCSK